jgi:ATP-dependent DNA helicase RecG
MDAPVLQDLKGVGQKLEETLGKLNIFSFEDLLFHFPFRFEDRTRITPIRLLKLKQLAVVDAEIVSSKILYGKRRSLSIGLSDESSMCFMRLFHFNKSQANQLANGRFIRVIGEPRMGSQGLELFHPEYRIYGDAPPPLDKTLTPVYHSCEGLSSKRISQLIDQALNLLDKHNQNSLLRNHFFDEKLNKEGKKRISLNNILQTIHRPQSWNDASLLSEGRHPFQKALALEELVAHSISAQNKKNIANDTGKSPFVFQFNKKLHDKLISPINL